MGSLVEKEELKGRDWGRVITNLHFLSYE